MKNDFFEMEVKKAQRKFNHVFGGLTVCDLILKQKIILAICFMGNLSRKIKDAKNADEARAHIKRFVRARGILKNLFDELEEEKRRLNVRAINSARGATSRERSVG